MIISLLVQLATISVHENLVMNKPICWNPRASSSRHSFKKMNSVFSSVREYFPAWDFDLIFKIVSGGLFAKAALEHLPTKA